MATTTRKPELTVAAIPSVAEARATLTGLRTEAAELQQLLHGERHTQVVRREQHQVVRQSGAVEVVQIDTPVTEVAFAPALDRLQARRRLVEVEAALAEAEEVLEVAKAAAVSAARVQRTEAIAAGDLVVRAALPGLIADMRKLQDRFTAFHAELARLDRAVGAEEYFQVQTACPAAMPGQVLDAWCRFVSDAFPPDRR